MPTSWTHYWTRECVAASRQRGHEGTRLNVSTGNLFLKRRVKKGDDVFILSATQETLYLIGRITVLDVIPYFVYVQKYRPKDLWPNKEVLIGSGTPCCLDRPIPQYAQSQLRFRSQRGDTPILRGLKRMDAQGFRGLHELHPDSAAFLNRFMKGAEKDPDLLCDE